MINGYKCFNKGMISRYGERFEIGKVYHRNGEIKFNRNGFHMCKNLEDTLRYFDAFNDEVDIGRVIGYGHINEFFDDYNEFYDMYAVEYMIIDHILSRDEIINYAMQLPPFRLIRFISLYKLTKEEIEIFRKLFYKDKRIIFNLDYYQNNDVKKYIKEK